MDISQVFREAVQARLPMYIKAPDYDPRTTDVLIQPHWIANRETVYNQKTGVYDKFDPPTPSLWCGVNAGNRVPGIEPLWVTNCDIRVELIADWRLATEDDITSRKIPQKVYREFDGHPFQNLLVGVDLALRKAWASDTVRSDFDPAPWIERDRKLAEFADEVSTWFT